MEACDAVLIVGEDITHTAPRMALSLRQTVRQEARRLADEARIPFWQDAAVRELAQQAKSPLYILHPCSTDLDDISAAVHHGKPSELTVLVSAIASLLEGPRLSEQDNSTLSETQKTLVKTIAGDLRAAKRPLLITGTSLQDEALALAMSTLVEALHQARESTVDCHFILAENNSQGLSILSADTPEKDLQSALNRIESGQAKRLVILENDLYQRVDNTRLDQAFDKLEEIVVIDHSWHQTAAKADLILPAASFAETEGTLVNSEGRAYPCGTCGERP